MAGTPEWLRQPPKFETRVPARSLPRIEAALRKRGLNKSGLVLYAVENILSERLPESQDGLQRVQINREIAKAAADALIARAEEKRRAADIVYAETSDFLKRAKLRKEAARLDEQAAWFLEIVEGARYRRHVIASGRKAPRHRYKDTAEAQTS